MDKLQTIGSALALAFTSVPASADRVISIGYQIGTDADYVALVDLDLVSRHGDFANAIADGYYVQPFMHADGQPRIGQAMRLLLNCKTNELRRWGMESLLDPRPDHATFMAEAPQVVPAASSLAIGMCGRPGKLEAPWELFNSEMRVAPETRKLLFPGSERFPWPGFAAAYESFVRVRASEMARRLNDGVQFWPENKPVAGVPAGPGFLATPFRFQYEGRNNGVSAFDAGYVDLGSVQQLADNQYFYGIIGVAVRRDNASLKRAGATRLPATDIGVELRCGTKPSHRISSIDEISGFDDVQSIGVPIANMKWSETLFDFSRALCARRIDAKASRVADAKAAAIALSTALLAKLP